MINTEMIHPEILKILTSVGHGSTILIDDGNFPITTVASLKISEYT